MRRSRVVGGRRGGLMTEGRKGWIGAQARGESCCEGDGSGRRSAHARALAAGQWRGVAAKQRRRRMRGKRRDRLLPERRQSQVWAQPLRPAGRRPWPPLGGASLPRGTAGSPKRTEGAKGYGGDQGFIKKRAGCGDRVSSQRREGGVALHHQGARRRREKEKEPSCCDSPLSSLCLFVTTLSLSLSYIGSAAAQSAMPCRPHARCSTCCGEGVPFLCSDQSIRPAPPCVGA